MGWKNEDRAKLVRSLRQAAVECGVEAVPDNASREKVREMVLPRVLRKMGVGDNLPRTLFTDRGPGFYHRKQGTVTSDYAEACQKLGFKLWAGSDSKRGDHAQPPDIADVLLHETAVSWIRQRLHATGTELKQPWRETPAELGKRLAGIVADINTKLDVHGLCMEFPDRLETLKKRKGDRLPK